jgi:hypothetical protein
MNTTSAKTQSFYLGRRPRATDQLAAQRGFADLACLDEFAANGACIRPKGHDGFHQDANSFAWEQAAQGWSPDDFDGQQDADEALEPRS